MLSCRTLFVGFCCLGCVASLPAQEAELILHSGKIVTVDRDFSIREALAVGADKLLAIGSDAEVRKLAGPATKQIDLQGRMVLPGLIDSHTHPTGASMIEFDHPIPDMQTIADVLDYITARAATVEPQSWIVVKQVFITRLKEQRFPTKAELDAAAPNNPVVFSTGPDASVNSLALKLSGIDKDFVSTITTGKIEKDPTTGEPTGILRSATKYLKTKTTEKSATDEQQAERLEQLFADYNAVGLTGTIDRNASPGALALYASLRDQQRLTVRMAASHAVPNTGSIESLVAKIAAVARHPLCKPDPWVRIVGIKTFLDGGMLTGSAYMREPWGVSRIYSIDDPRYQGIRYMDLETLTPMVQAAVANGLQFTAHSVGDGAVHTLLDAYEAVNRSTPIAVTRPCITHSNFMSSEAIDQAARLGVVVDIQPAWLWLDGRTLSAQFGYDRLRWFQPLRTLAERGVVAGGGSDHMQKIGPLRSINPYHPFLGMWVTITRQARDDERPLHPEEALTRRQALEFYTINNARLMFLQDQIGSLEAGKLADFIVVDRDVLGCPIDELRTTQVLSTYVGGKRVYER